MTVLPIGRGQTMLMWLYYIYFFQTVVPAPGGRHIWSTGGMITRRWKSKWKEKKPAPLPHPPKVCVYYFCDRIWDYVLRRWLITTWTTLTHSFTCSLIHSLKPYLPLEKLTAALVSRNSLYFIKHMMFNTMFTRTCFWSLSWARWIHFTCSQSTAKTFISYYLSINA